jgi:hypothetical protein
VWYSNRNFSLRTFDTPEEYNAFLLFRLTKISAPKKPKNMRHYVLQKVHIIKLTIHVCARSRIMQHRKMVREFEKNKWRIKCRKNQNHFL